MHVLTKELSITSAHYKKVLSVLKDAGGKARVVGGAVRDNLLNRANSDIDIVVDLVPEQVMHILSRANMHVIPTGISHGTITDLLYNEKFEITTLRKDINCDGRHAEVEFTDDFMEDAARRDFTINALSYCPFENKIYDYFNGIEDLYNSKVVFIGEARCRIQEDYLRILRFFRFSCYYAKALDASGLSACIELKENLTSLSKERIKLEMDKLVVADNGPNILQEMFDCGILQIIFPVVEFHHEDFQHSSSLLDVRYSLLFYHIKDLTLRSLINLKFSRKEANSILSLINFARLAHNDFTLKKMWIENEDYEHYLMVLLALGKINSSAVRNFDNLSVKPVFPITGHDLHNLNIHGKNVGILLTRLKDYWIESDFITNKDQLLELLKGYNEN